jgi:hypothetical protein
MLLDAIGATSVCCAAADRRQCLDQRGGCRTHVGPLGSPRQLAQVIRIRLRNLAQRLAGVWAEGEHQARDLAGAP